LGLGLLLVLLAAVVFYGHHRALGMHLSQLTASMSRVARGERRHRFNYRGPREIVQLGESFNHMLNSIDAAERALGEHRKNRDRLKNKLRQAEKLAALGRLAAGTAHELGTPLSVISGQAQRALRRENLPEEQRQALGGIRKEVERMGYIIRQLLDFSRSSPLRRSLVAPARLAESAAASVRETAAANGTRIGLAGSAKIAPIALDTMRIQQALINLLRNAVQCRPSGRVRCSWGTNEEGVFFGVDDDGPGVPPEIRSKIFEPFFTTKSVVEGTGLGLSVAHTVAEEHGGTIEVGESRMGGASFLLLIPAGEVEVKDE
jgi:signal transduction histidine kinase